MCEKKGKFLAYWLLPVIKLRIQYCFEIDLIPCKEKCGISSLNMYVQVTHYPEIKILPASHISWTLLLIFSNNTQIFIIMCIFLSEVTVSCEQFVYWILLLYLMNIISHAFETQSKYINWSVLRTITYLFMLRVSLLIFSHILPNGICWPFFWKKPESPFDRILERFLT